ncbi:MAG: polysaccharide pyruvyl transferase family protein [Anaerolineales bacterium]
MGDDIMGLNILIINLHSSRNAGDAALTQVTLEQLAQAFPDSQVTLAMDDPHSHQGMERTIGSLFTWVTRVAADGQPRWRKMGLLWMLPASLAPVITQRLFKRPWFGLTPAGWRNLMQAYLQADLVVSKPGGFLYSSGRGVTLLISLYSLALALLAGKALYLFPQSIGPFLFGWECRLLRAILSRARLVMVREPVSAKQLEQCGLSSQQFKLMPDVAFAFKGAPRTEALAWLQEHGSDPTTGQPLMGMTAINWSGQNPRFNTQAQYENACAAAARYFVNELGGKVVLFPQVTGPLSSQDDRVPARRIAQQAGCKGDTITVIEEAAAPEMLKAAYGFMDVFIGTRMHSNIFALSQCVPVIAIGYQHKTSGIARMAGIADWVVEIESLDERLMVESIKRLWGQRQAVSDRIREVMPAILQAAGQPGEMTAADYAQWVEEYG